MEGNVPPWGSTVRDPHTASPAVASIPTSRKTHVKSTPRLRFSSAPRGCRHLRIPSNSFRAAEGILRCSCLGESHSAQLHERPQPPPASHVRWPSEEQEKKLHIRSSVAFRLPEDLIRHLAKPSQIRVRLHYVPRPHTTVVPGGTLGPPNRRLAEVDPKTGLAPGTKNLRLPALPPYWRPVDKGRGLSCVLQNLTWDALTGESRQPDHLQPHGPTGTCQCHNGSTGPRAEEISFDASCHIRHLRHIASS